MSITISPNNAINDNDIALRIGDGVPLFMRNLHTSSEVTINLLKNSVESLLKRFDGELYKGVAFIDNFLKVESINEYGVIFNKDGNVLIRGLAFRPFLDTNTVPITGFTGGSSFVIALNFKTEYYSNEDDAVDIQGMEQTSKRKRIIFFLTEEAGDFRENYIDLYDDSKENINTKIALFKVDNFGTVQQSITDLRYVVRNTLFTEEYRDRLDTFINEAIYVDEDGIRYTILKQREPEYPTQVTDVVTSIKKVVNPINSLELSDLEKELANIAYNGNYTLDISWEAPLTKIGGGSLTQKIKKYMVKKYVLSSPLTSGQILDIDNLDISEVINSASASKVEILYTQENIDTKKPNNSSFDVSQVRDLRAISTDCKWGDYIVIAIYPVTELDKLGASKNLYIDIRTLTNDGAIIKDTYSQAVKEISAPLKEDVLSSSLNILKLDISDRTASEPAVTGASHTLKDIDITCTLTGVPQNAPLIWELRYTWYRYGETSNTPIEQGLTKHLTNKFRLPKPDSSSSVWNTAGLGGLAVSVKAINPFTDTESIESSQVVMEVSAFHNITAADMIVALVSDTDSMTAFTNSLTANATLVSALKTALQQSES